MVSMLTEAVPFCVSDMIQLQFQEAKRIAVFLQAVGSLVSRKT